MWFRAYLRNFTISKTTISDDSDTGSETEVEEEEECENLINANVTEDFGTENDGTRFKAMLKPIFEKCFN